MTRIQTKHTPGPWSAERDPCHYDTLSTVVGGKHFSYNPADESFVLPRELIVQVGGQASHMVQEANTRLISAAPDMLAALKECSEWLKFYGPVGSTPDSAKFMAQTVDAAIANAEGRAE